MTLKEICYVDCATLDKRIDYFQGLFDGVELIILYNILFFGLFYTYIILRKYNKCNDGVYFMVVKNGGFFVFACDLFYFYLYML